MYGSYAFTIPANGVLRNLNVSYDASVPIVGATEFITLEYRFFKSACNNGPTNPYMDTGYFADAVGIGTLLPLELSGCGFNAGSLAVNANDRVVLQVKATQISFLPVFSLALSASVEFVPS